MTWKAVAASLESFEDNYNYEFSAFFMTVMIMIISSEFLENFVIKTKRCKVNLAFVTGVKKNSQQKNWK